jgi:pilus assembly protein FimV
MRNRKLYLLMLIVSLAPVSAYALGLGELELRSYLSQPLVAEVELVGVQPGDAEVLAARLASSEAHQKAGIDRPFSLSALKFSVLERAGGLPYLRVTTREPVKEPYFHFLLELSSADGRVLRDYTLLLDPPPKPGAPKVAATQVEMAKIVRVPESANDLKMPVVAGGTNEYGPTEIGDTLWEIALQIRPDGVSVKQAMLAIARDNPQAFIGGNINQMLAGKVLNLPGAEAYRQLDSQEASAEFARQQQAWQQFRESAPPVIAPPTAVADTGGGSVVRELPGVETAEQGYSASAGRVRLLADKGSATQGSGRSVGSTTGSANDITDHIELLEESLDVRERENEELRNQIVLLEKELATLREMLEVDQTLTSAAGGATKTADPVTDTVEALPEQLAEDVPTDDEPVSADIPLVADGDVVEPAAEENDAVSPKGVPTPAEKPAIAVKPGPPLAPDVNERTRPRPVNSSPASSGWLDLLMDNLLYLGGAVLLVVLVVVGLALRGGKKEQSAASTEFDLDDEEATLVRTPAEVATSPEVDKPARIEDSFAETATLTSEDTESFLDDFSAPSVGATAEAELEDVDPIAEADVFITYGHHEQAEEIILDAIQFDDRIDLKLKLLDIYFAQEKAQEYEEFAAEIRPLLADDDSLWAKVVALGHALNPTSELFRDSSLDASEVGSLVVTSSVEDELDLGAEMDDEQIAQVDDASESFNLDDFVEPSGDDPLDEYVDETSEFTTSELSTSIDLDAFAEESIEDGAEDSAISLDVFEEEIDSDASPVDADPENTTDGLSMDEEPADGGVAAVGLEDQGLVDSGLEMDLDVSPGGAGSVAAEGDNGEEDEGTINIDSLVFDDGFENDGKEPASDNKNKNLVTDDGGAVLDFDLDGDAPVELALDENAASLETVKVDAGDVVDFDQNFDDEDSAADTSLDIEFDMGESLEFDLPETALDTGDEGGTKAPEETLEFDSIELEPVEQQGSGSEEGDGFLVLDEESAGLDETVSSFSLDEDSSGEIDTVQNLDAVASQLDLLAAYVDMGDSDQALALNEKIQSHGNDQQKQQADELISKLND